MMSKNIPEEKAKEYFDVVKKINPNETITTIFEYLKACGFDESWYAFLNLLWLDLLHIPPVLFGK